jgi:flagellar biosynthesis protein FlhB
VSGQQDNDAERTEAPSDKRRREFRERGEVAKSAELTSAIMLLAGAGAIAALTRFSGARMQQLLLGTLGRLDDAHLWAGAPIELVNASMTAFIRPLLPAFAILVVAGIAANVGQFGFLWSPKALGFQASRMNPVKGLGRMFASKDAIANLIKTIVKVAFIGTMATVMMMSHADLMPALVGYNPVGIGGHMLRLAIQPMVACGLVMVAIGVAHYAWQRHQQEEKMKMTREEAKREHKESDGDPQMKNRRRQVARERLNANNLIEAVPRASVIINNPTHYSVAIQYSAELGIPVVVAKGVDHRAQKIREIAKQNQIPMITSPPLARALHKNVDVGDAIPEQFFRAVAEILAWVMTQSARRKATRQR